MNLTQFSKEFSAFCLRGPDERQRLGLTDNIGHFSKIDPDATAHEIATARHLLTELESLDDRDDLDLEADTNCELYRLYLSRFILEQTLVYNGSTNVEQMPIAAATIGDSIFGLLINDPRGEAQRCADIVSRIADIPNYLQQAQQRLTRPVVRWAAIEQDAIIGLPELLDTAAQFIEAHAPSLLETMREAQSSAQQAFTAYSAFLSQIPKSQNFAIGSEGALAVIQSRGIELSLAELHGIASDFLKKTRAQIDELRGTLCERYHLAASTSAESLQQHLIKTYEVTCNGGLESILDRYRSEEERVLKFINRTQLFPVPDNQAIEILRTPSFLEPTIPAGAMLAPAALREGVKKSLVYLTLSEGLLDEHNELSIPVMMIHEGIPGHHLQLATASTHEDFIRRIFDAMDLAEGWTTMLEDYMLDQGYAGELTDEVRFMAKREICRIAARVAIDLYFMTGDDSYLDIDGFAIPDTEDPFQKAGALLKSVTGFVDERVQAELNWYSRERGYPLSYLTGNHLMWSLKQAFVKRHGSSAKTDRLFHENILKSGNMPLNLMRKRFHEKGWI